MPSCTRGGPEVSVASVVSARCQLELPPPFERRTFAVCLFVKAPTESATLYRPVQLVVVAVFIESHTDQLLVVLALGLAGAAASTERRLGGGGGGVTDMLVPSSLLALEVRPKLVVDAVREWVK